MGAGKKNNASFQYSIEKTSGKSTHTLVFIHDIGFDRRLWFPIMTEIGSDVAAVAYDLDGFGANSGRHLPPHTMEYHVDTLCAVLDRLRVKNPILIGLRFGAHVALQALRRDNERWRGALIGGVLPYPPTAAEYTEVSQMIAELPANGSAHYADGLISGLSVDDENTAQLRYQISSSAEHNIAAALTARLTRPSALNALLACPHPIYLLSGQNQSERIQKECIGISLNQPNMAIIRIPESTTLYNLENPRAFHHAVVRFMKLFEQEQ